MQPLAELAKTDSTSDWVRVLGHTLGGVGVTGKMTPLGDLDSGSAVRAEIESGVEQVYSAVVAKLPEFKLTTGVLSYVSPEVAEATAPPAIRNVYGDRPTSELLAQILASAKDKIRSETEVRIPPGNPNTRRASAAPLNRAGLGTTAAARRGAEAVSGDGTTPAPARVIRKFNMEDAGEAMKERDRLMQAQKDKAAEEREAKRLKQQADAAERKRKREENAEKKRAAAEARPSAGRPGRPRGSTNRNRSHNASDEEQSGNESGGDSATAADDDNVRSPKRRSTRSSPAAARQNVYVPPEGYLTFAGNDPQIRAVYANTNALTDEDRLHMYCFFNAYPSPPNAPQKLNIMLNEQVIDDPVYPGKTCSEIMVLEADFVEGTWSKKRKTRRT
ncbi:hypothetical protein GGI06_001104 [Coemansia sp. S85]|nr:hypothetical protein GGI06_001104 [Coemansia sp. S85]